MSAIQRFHCIIEKKRQEPAIVANQKKTINTVIFCARTNDTFTLTKKAASMCQVIQYMSRYEAYTHVESYENGNAHWTESV